MVKKSTQAMVPRSIIFRTNMRLNKYAIFAMLQVEDFDAKFTELQTKLRPLLNQCEAYLAVS